MLAPVPIEEVPESEAVESDGMSVTSFLANEKLMLLDSMNSDITGKGGICPILTVKRYHIDILTVNSNQSINGLMLVYTSADDDDLDIDNLQDDELQLYFKKLIPPAMQRGRVEGQEIPAAVSYWCT